MATLFAHRSGTSHGALGLRGAPDLTEKVLIGVAAGGTSRDDALGETGALRLILAEDSPQDVALYTAMLQSTALSQVFDVVVVDRLADCVAAVARYRPACILLDLGLPDVDGVEGLERLRIVAPGVPVVVLTGTSDEAVGLQAVKCGAQDYLVKSEVDGAALARSVRYAIERAQSEQRLHFLAFHDSLTELANRALFADRLEVALAHSRRRTLPSDRAHGFAAGSEAQATPAVLVIDLDHFKVVNDSLGHSGGDLLLRAVADRLRAEVRPSDTVARLGGDEFAILCEGANAGQVAGVAQRVIDALAAPFVLDGAEAIIGGSVGVAMADPASTDADGLLRKADMAMYSAKAAGRGRFVLFQEHIRAHRPAVVDAVAVALTGQA